VALSSVCACTLFLAGCLQDIRHGVHSLDSDTARKPGVSHGSAAAGELGDVLILTLDLLHCLGFQFLCTPVQPDEQSPGGEEGRGHQPNRRRIR
jgi:hypothetical protein